MTTPPADALDALIDEAYTYAFALFEIARTRHHDLHHADPALRIAPNTAWHDRRLCDHESRWITTPNNDTLYSRGWLDLSGGPVRVTVDAMPPGRYWSVAFMDAVSNNFAMLGQRLDGVGPVSVTLAGPRHTGPLPAGRVVRAPGDDVWLLGRWIVDGPGDLPAAHAMQDRLQVEVLEAAGADATKPGGPVPHGCFDAVAASGAAAPPEGAPAPLDHLDAAAFLAVVNAGLARNPAPPADAAVLARCAAVGLRPGEPDVWRRLDPSIRAAWLARIGAAYEGVRRSIPRLSHRVQGWHVRGPELGNFGTNYAERSAIALGGLGALEPIEAVYASRATDAADERLDGSRRYILRIRPGSLPADGFWSLSMYEQTRDGRLFFADNPIGRYTIGDRTPGTCPDADGTLRIALQHDAPADPDLRANWLPAPAGPFVLTLRVYLPHPELRAWQVPLPTIEPQG